MSWQPISTAPKDGTEILLFHVICGVAFIEGGSYYDDEEEWISTGRRYRLSPTDWMPIPLAPEWWRSDWSEPPK